MIWTIGRINIKCPAQNPVWCWQILFWRGNPSYRLFSSIRLYGHMAMLVHLYTTCVSLPSLMEELSTVDSDHSKIFTLSFFLENVHQSYQSYPQPCLIGSEKLPIKSHFISNSLFSVTELFVTHLVACPTNYNHLTWSSHAYHNFHITWYCLSQMSLHCLQRPINT